MKLLQVATTNALAFICCCLCHCASADSSGPPKIVFGFLPPDLSIKSRSPIPALTLRQAIEKKVPSFETAFRVKPAGELIAFDKNTALQVIHVPSNSQVLQRDYPAFARGLVTMAAFIKSNPADYPDTPQPDFVPFNAAVFIDAKIRCIELPWGKAVIMLAQYTQEAHPPPPNSDDLRIWIRGMSHAALSGEGGFCLSGELTVKHPLLKTRDAACAEIEGQDETQAMAKADKQLDSYADDLFTPSIRDIERMLRELKVEVVRS